MARRLLNKIKTSDALPAALVVLRAIRDSSDTFPIKSAAAACIVIWETSQVLLRLCYLIRHDLTTQNQNAKSMRRDLTRLANRAVEVFADVCGKVKDVEYKLPPNAQENLARIEQ
jgi:hypothetical protein